MSAFLQKITADNPGPLTFEGTNTYLLGENEVLIVDPGPLSQKHQAAIFAALAGRPVAGLIATHTHKDHTESLAELAGRLNAPILGPEPHQFFRPLSAGETHGHETSVDFDHAPTVETLPKTVIVDGVKVEVLPTPGHTRNHISLAVTEENFVLTGDHIMGWSSTVIAPPDGELKSYLASLKTVEALGEMTYFPGHGHMIENGQTRAKELYAHRLNRLAEMEEALRQGPISLAALTRAIYGPMEGLLQKAATLSTLAQLEYLEDEGRACRIENGLWGAG